MKTTQSGSSIKPIVGVSSAKTLKEAIEREDDFGHEMKVGEILRQVPGMRVEHGGTYTDPVEGKPREFDFRCYLGRTDFPLRIDMAVECKRLSPEAPLVISGTTRTSEESFHEFVGVEFIGSMRSAAGRRYQRIQRLYPSGEFVGKSVMRYKRPDKNPAIFERANAQESEIYGRWSQAIASCHELCLRAAYAATPKIPSASVLVLPVVVVPEGTLWQMAYLPDGSTGSGPDPVDTVSYFVNREVRVSDHVYINIMMRLSHVHFMTRAGLKIFLQELVRAGNEWVDYF